jgi:hypothetical protein
MIASARASTVCETARPSALAVSVALLLNRYRFRFSTKRKIRFLFNETGSDFGRAGNIG